MNKVVVLIFLLFTINDMALGQGSCDITADQSPTIRGFRLGMTLSHLYELVPEARNDRNAIAALNNIKSEKLPSILSIQLNGIEPPYNAIPRFQNVDYILLRFFNNQLISLSVQYNWPSWNNVNEFIAKLRESLAIPVAEDWKGSDVQKSIRCKDFDLHVSTHSNVGGNISIDDSTIAKKMDDLRKTTLEKARNEFKP